jgi:hypothetical protein
MKCGYINLLRWGRGGTALSSPSSPFLHVNTLMYRYVMNPANRTAKVGRAQSLPRT